MERESRSRDSSKETPDISFSQQLHEMPAILQSKFVKYVLVAFGLVILSVAMVFYFKSWTYSAGLLGSLFVLYLGMDLVWSFHSGKLICKKMICIKVTKIPKQERLIVYMKDLDPTVSPKEAIHQFYAIGAKRELKMFETNTVMNIYYRPSNPLEISAWEVIDYISQ